MSREETTDEDSVIVSTVIKAEGSAVEISVMKFPNAKIAAKRALSMAWDLKCDHMFDLIEDIQKNAPDMIVKEGSFRNIVHLAVEKATGEWQVTPDSPAEWADVETWPELLPWRNCTERTRAEVHNIMAAYSNLKAQAEGRTRLFIEFFNFLGSELRITFERLPKTEVKTGKLVFTSNAARAIRRVCEHDGEHKILPFGLRML